MVGWSKFDAAKPNVSCVIELFLSMDATKQSLTNVLNKQKGHFALAELERMGLLGVTMEDRPSFYEDDQVDDYYFSSGHRKLAIVTQNVDSLHQRAGSKEVIQLHGGGSQLKCMGCGKRHDRNEYHRDLESRNKEWLEEAMQGYEKSSGLRPDGDAVVKEIDYNHVHVPNCPHCQTGFYKPDVVFFGDTVPKHRVEICQEAVEQADGILVVGSSLAVHSAFRHIRAAHAKGTPVAILNVGETRAETEGLDVLKIEAPASDTLEMCVQQFLEEQPTSKVATF